MRRAFTCKSNAARLVLAALAATAITACGDDEDDDKGGGGASKPQAQKLAVSVTKEGKDKFGLSAPTSVKAGLVEISLQTPASTADEEGSPGVTHDAQIVRVEGNHTVEEVLKAIDEEGAPTPPWLFAAGGVGQAKSGPTRTATQVLTPGKYFILDTGEPEGEDVKSYAETGATAELEVTGQAATATLPKAAASITAEDSGTGKAKEYGFSTTGLKAGTNQIKFANTGEELHHVIAFPYNKGTTLADVKKAFMQDGPPSGPPPVDFENTVGTPVLEGGTEQVTSIELKSGKYALVCFISDRKGGPPHVAKGMIAETTVK